MQPQLCLLLPLLSEQQLEQFLGSPVKALLAPDNLPSVSSLHRPLFCPIASSAVLDRFRESGGWARIAQYASVEPITVDDLVVDYPFDVLPSLASAGKVPAQR